MDVHIKTEAEESLSKYGWTLKEKEVFNTKGNKVFTIEMKGSKYSFLDMAGNKLMSGNGKIGESLDKLLSRYYFCKKI